MSKLPFHIGLTFDLGPEDWPPEWECRVVEEGIFWRRRINDCTGTICYSPTLSGVYENLKRLVLHNDYVITNIKPSEDYTT